MAAAKSFTWLGNDSSRPLLLQPVFPDRAIAVASGISDSNDSAWELQA